MKKNILQNKIMLSTIVASIFFLFLEINFNIFYEIFVPPNIAQNQLNKNIDWLIIPLTIDCHNLGFDVYINNPCDVLKRNHAYGLTSLFLPFFANIKKFYLIYFPFILKFLFILNIFLIFSFKKKKEECLIVFLFFISSPFLLVYERSNTDILIFVLVFLILNIKSFIINFFLILYISSYKFFPIVMFTNFFFFIKKKNSFFLLIIIFFIILLFNFTKISYLLINKTYDVHFAAIFSFSGMPELLFSFLNKNNLINLLLIKIYYLFDFSFNFEFFKYFFLKKFSYFFIILFILVLFCIKFKKIKFLINIKNTCKNSYFEKSSFLASSSIILFCYFFFPSFYYREIFIVLLFPYLLKLSCSGCLFSNFFKNFTIFKIISTSVCFYLIYYLENIWVTGILSGVRHLVDLFFIGLLLVSNIQFYKKFFYIKNA